MKPTLLVLAAGMGSRYGGLKQLDPMGPKGETLLDYSVRHAIQAGFKKAVFVIREDFAKLFKERVASKYSAEIEIDYAFQKITDLPEGFEAPPTRTRPWGTAHAVWAARTRVSDPFVTINADDYYGADAYHRAISFLKECHPATADKIAMVGYPILNTLSAHGRVNRGICKIRNSQLETVEEHTGIREEAGGSIIGINQTGAPVEIKPDSLVSMNFWALTPPFFEIIERVVVDFFEDFKDSVAGQSEAECYIPTVVDNFIQSGEGSCQILPTDGNWFGVTYPADKERVQAKLRELKDNVK